MIAHERITFAGAWERFQDSKMCCSGRLEFPYSTDCCVYESFVNKFYLQVVSLLMASVHAKVISQMLQNDCEIFPNPCFCTLCFDRCWLRMVQMALYKTMKSLVIHFISMK